MAQLDDFERQAVRALAEHLIAQQGMDRERAEKAARALVLQGAGAGEMAALDAHSPLPSPLASGARHRYVFRSRIEVVLPGDARGRGIAERIDRLIRSALRADGLEIPPESAIAYPECVYTEVIALTFEEAPDDDEQ